ncbi:MAG: cysteine--tRNA ligase [Acidobacteria bacterium]|nr:cysteine--tRNA ligase [Acidobacteriota bacterium]
MLRFYNTLTSQVEQFQPLDPRRVRVYTCGPTVYDFAHIGNFRSFVFQDILRRTLRARGYEVFQVMNITDVDDRTIENSTAAGMSLRDYTEKFARAFLQDMQLLSLEKPEKIVRATEHIDAMVALVQRLMEKGFAYRSDGSVYFRIAKFPTYGRLSKIDLSGIKTGARVDVQEYDKSDPRDFALWKAAKPGEPSWETPLGPGRPGWHIECSAMAMKYLGESFDIHTGGVDLVFPHHENEIAQSEAATGKLFVRLWLHCEHLLVEGERMAKSKGNFYTLRDLLARGHKPSAIRYLLASVPRRKQLNFTFDGLHQATQSVERLRNFRLRLRTEKFPGGTSAAVAKRIAEAGQAFDAALDDDLNTAEALAAVFDLLRDLNAAMDRGEFHQGDRAAVEQLLERYNGIFAVLAEDDYQKLAAVKDQMDVPVPVPVGADALSDAEVERLLGDRRQARARRDFARADEIRQELFDRGIIVEDTKDGVRWKRK